MQVYLVGGAVRDALLGLAVADCDYVVVGATPEMMLQRGFKQVGQDFPVFLHPESGEEYALARTERKTGRGHQGFRFAYAPSVTLEEDLLRRDLTINAMAQAADGRLIDPYGGAADIQARVLRHVSAAFAEDPLRVLRLMRFYARFAPLGFAIAPETLRLCRDMVIAGELSALTPERVWAECEKALGYAQPWHFFMGLAEVGALAVLLGEAADDLSHEQLQTMAQALQSACQRIDDVAIRFAAWLRMCSPCARAAVETLRLPNKVQYWIALLHHQQATAEHWARASAAEKWQLLKASGSLRQAGDLGKLLAAVGAPPEAIEDITAQAEAVQGLDIALLQEKGYRGAALGQAIVEAQQRILAQFG